MEITPGIEEGGPRRDSEPMETKDAKDVLRGSWRKLVDSEERLRFFKYMVGRELEVRDIEHFGDDLNEKFKSEKMRGGRSERAVIKAIMELKLKDERRFQREIKKRRDRDKRELERQMDSKNSFKVIISQINGEAVKWRKMERSKFESKIEHLKRLRREREEEELQKCPEEIKDYNKLIIFNKEEIEKLKKEDVEVTVIGKVDLDNDEKAVLKLPPKFAVRCKLDDIDMQTEVEMGMAKIRYQTRKEEQVRNIDEIDEIEENTENKVVKRQRLDSEQIAELEHLERLDAEGRRVYDPIGKSFDHGNKRCTDLQENSKVNLPGPCDKFTESSIELLRNNIMKAYRKCKKRLCNEKGEQTTNLTREEQRGLRKLQKRIRNHEILVIKTDKSGKLAVIDRDKYLEMGKEKCLQDRKIGREEHREIERRIEDHTRFWCKMLKSGINHEHQDRITKSKISHSENAAPMYFMYKDHKVEGGYRPVVGGCNSDSLGLSNILSEVIESVGNSIENPFEVISSEDMLSRIVESNKKLEVMKAEKGENWDWREEMVLLGSDVKSLFPSLSAFQTGKAVRRQFEKSPINWENVDWKLVSLYVKIQEKYWEEKDLSDIKMYLPERISKAGRPPSIGTLGVESRYRWPGSLELISMKHKKKLLALAIERAVVFFFRNFVYTFGGEIFLQLKGGPIGARVTMAVSKLVMEEWKIEFNKILKGSEIEELLSGNYVDDGRSYQRKLNWGERFDSALNRIVWDKEKEKVDEKENVDRTELTRKEMLRAMNSVSSDLSFTMEVCNDFDNLRLPTLSFSLFIGEKGIEHTYFEKSMKNQTLVMERSSISRQQLMSIMTNELRRRLEVIGENIPQEEKNRIVNVYTQQLKNSGYNWKQTRDIIISGLKGHERREKRRKEKGLPKYRSGKMSLSKRTNKKLLEKYNWFRVKRNEEKEEKNDEKGNLMKKK